MTALWPHVYSMTVYRQRALFRVFMVYDARRERPAAAAAAAAAAHWVFLAAGTGSRWYKNTKENTMTAAIIEKALA